ncbi:MAG TPA: L-aspartate oxidase [Limnochordia bacterium]
MTRIETDFVIVGSGVAGLSTALKAAKYGRVALLTKGTLSESNTAYAQGGIAAALAPGDSPQAHAADTLLAGGELCRPEAVHVLVRQGPARVQELIALGARFDQAPDGALALTREAAHSRNRVLHARGDSTGAEISETLVARVLERREIEVHEHFLAADLVVTPGRGRRCVGVWGVAASGEVVVCTARAVVLATGGCGQLYRYTTNPFVTTGDGLAMAHRAGVPLVDMEFIQFHPTALAVPANPMVLISEAVRGEGARLIDETGRPFMSRYHPWAELAPRDVVARAIFSEMAAGRRVLLDATGLSVPFEERFPSIFKACAARGIDPRREPIPVTPAAHFIMGGIETDTRGRTRLPGLFACGEVACTGVHGANRLASNSLLEGLVFADRVAAELSRLSDGARPRPREVASLPNMVDPSGKSILLDRPANFGTLPAADRLRQVMWDLVGIVRHAEGLQTALAEIDALSAAEPQALVYRNMLQVARLIARAALARPESRGGHYRSDFPAPDPAWRRRHVRL